MGFCYVKSFWISKGKNGAFGLKIKIDKSKNTHKFHLKNKANFAQDSRTSNNSQFGTKEPGSTDSRGTK